MAALRLVYSNDAAVQAPQEAKERMSNFTALPNAVLDSLCRSKSIDRKTRVFLAIVRKTISYGKKADRISLSQIVEMTDIAYSHISELITALVAEGLVVKGATKGIGQTLGIAMGNLPISGESTQIQDREIYPDSGTTKEITTTQPNGCVFVGKKKGAGVTYALRGKSSGLNAEQAERFTKFWDAFGLKAGKANAVDSWAAIKPSADLADRIIEAARRQHAQCLRNGDTKRKWAQGWLTERRWEDESLWLDSWTADQQAVIDSFHESLGDQMVNVVAFSPDLAALIDAAGTSFRSGLLDGTKKYFAHIAHNCTFKRPENISLAWLLNQETIDSIRGGKFQKEAKQ